MIVTARGEKYVVEKVGGREKGEECCCCCNCCRNLCCCYAGASPRHTWCVCVQGEEWDGGSRGKVYTKGKRGKGFA